MVITARAIININNSYLFIKRTNKPNSNYKEFYAFPGGHVEENETIEETCIREIKEEIGIDVKIAKEFYINKNEDMNTTEYYYLVDYVSGKIGSGTGPEFTNRDEERYGKYEVVLIDKDKLESYEILPKNIKAMLIDYIK